VQYVGQLDINQAHGQAENGCTEYNNSQAKELADLALKSTLKMSNVFI
jgi:hypothetical protein